MVEMWERLSLRTRLLLPLGLMFVAALLAGAVSLQIFATAQLMEESEPAARSARAVAAALNGALRSSSNPQATLTILFDGGNIRHNGTLRGGHVSGFVLHGVHHDIGLFECE